MEASLRVFLLSWLRRETQSLEQGLSRGMTRLKNPAGDTREHVLEKDKISKLNRRTESLSNIATSYRQHPAGGGGFRCGDGMLGSSFSAQGRGEIKQPAVLTHRNGMLEACLIFRAGLWWARRCTVSCNSCQFPVHLSEMSCWQFVQSRDHTPPNSPALSHSCSPLLDH